MNESDRGFFDVTPQAILNRIQRDLVLFDESANALDLLNLVVWLNHLSEWVIRDGDKGQKFVDSLGKTDDFQILRSLSNRGKHHTINHRNARRVETAQFRFARAGSMRSGDALGQEHYLADGRDVRDVVFSVYRSYLDYFDEDQEHRITGE